MPDHAKGSGLRVARENVAVTIALSVFLLGCCTARGRPSPSPSSSPSSSPAASPSPPAAPSPPAPPSPPPAPPETQPAVVEAPPAPATATAPAPAATPTTIPKNKPDPRQPTTKRACKKCNGVWAIHGLADVAGCNCRTKDKGKSCRDGKDCQGSCVADENRFEVVSPGPPPRGFYTGTCSEFAITFGCFKFIPEGILAKGPQLKEDAVDEMCID